MACESVPNYNEFIGDGVTVDYAFTFPYVNKIDVQVRYGTYPDYTYADTTEYSISDANPTVVTFNSAPSGPFRIYRCTPTDSLEATFQAGSAIRAADLNDNFEQMLYIVQDANNNSDGAVISADDAYELANIAIDKADGAIETANEALETAERAENKADGALELISDSIAGEIVGTVNDLPGNPVDGAIYTVVDSTGVENLTPIKSLPAGFVGNPKISVKLRWDTDTWEFIQALVSDPFDIDLDFVTDNGNTTTNDITVGNITASTVTATNLVGNGSGITGVVHSVNGDTGDVTIATPTLQSVTDAGSTTDNKIEAAGFRIDLLPTITKDSP